MVVKKNSGKRMIDCNSDSLEERIQCLMYEKKFKEIQDVLENADHQILVENQAMNLVSVVCSIMKANTEFLKEPVQYKYCSDIIMHLIGKGNPKEVLLGLLESADSFKEDEYFVFLLQPLRKLLINMPGKSLDWVLNVLHAHLMSLPAPECKDLKGKELLLMDLDPVVQRTSFVLKEYLDFLQFFVREVSFKNSIKIKVQPEDTIYKQQLILQKYLLLLLENPLLYHDLHFRPNQAISSIQASCSRIIDFLREICKNFFNLYKLVDNNDSCGNISKVDEENSVSLLSIANLSYLMFFENMASSHIPQVYSHTYLFELHLDLISSLLCRNENLVIFKGLNLCCTLLDKLPDNDLPTQNSKAELAVQLSKNFFDIAVYSSSKDYRFLAVSLFKKYIRKFRSKERYVHLMHMLSLFQHAGVQGLIINMYKDFLHTEIKENISEKCFSGKNLLAFMRLAIHLKDGAKTDILESYDKILSCLNFVRFLALYDDHLTNVTGFWLVAENLMKDYLEPLHQGIELTRAHYKLAADSANGINDELETDAVTSVTVNGESLPNLPPDYKAVIFEKAMLSLDMVESILTRVKELLEKPGK